jgi:hypothetical protein
MRGSLLTLIISLLTSSLESRASPLLYLQTAAAKLVAAMLPSQSLAAFSHSFASYVVRLDSGLS